MYHYLFTNDLRITNLKDALVHAGTCFLTDTIPSANENKSENNNINTLGFYFNLTVASNCTKLAAAGKVEPIVTNFIKKFQYPNLRTPDSYDQSISDGIVLAPMRIIIKVLYIMKMLYDDSEAYLTKNEIRDFIFYNDDVAKIKLPNFDILIMQIFEHRKNGRIPASINTNTQERQWKQEDRQLREMIKILCFSGLIENDSASIRLTNNLFSSNMKIAIYDILNFKEIWAGSSLEEYQSYMDISSEEMTSDSTYPLEMPSELIGYNKIYYGIPGCGKSHYIEHVLLQNINQEHDVFRTTFFLDYSNSDFVGQIYPVVCDDGSIKYSPLPGPFTKALERAYTEKNKMIYLIIEEINRGNAAAIFGDLFQLLDRLKAPSADGRITGDSEYPISNEFIESYFKSKGIPYKTNKIIIPHNMTILATMNTSDQNVFPLDTAFKRRWDRERVLSNWEEVEIADLCIPFTDWTWRNFAQTVNIKMITDSNDGTVTEDKNLGPYFANKEMLVEKERRYDDTEKNKAKLVRFVNNVIDYLFLDVAKFEKEILFNANLQYNDVYNTFLNLCKSNVSIQEANQLLDIFSNKITPDIIDELSKVEKNDEEIQ